MDINYHLIPAWLREAGEIALEQRKKLQVGYYYDSSPFTNIDRAIELHLVQRITALYPHHTILSEEGGGRKAESPYTWVIDPIDGTRAFACGLPIWGVSVGLLYQDQPLAGGLYLPVTGELFWGAEGAAFYNGQPLPAQDGPGIDPRLLFLAVPSNAHQEYTIRYNRLRSLGSFAAHLAYLCLGAAVGVLSRRFKLWDIAGVLPVMEAVHVRMVYLSGKPLQLASLLDGRPVEEAIVAAPQNRLDEVRSWISYHPTPG